MSYRECRNFIQMLRSLGYPRLVSMENFKKPNFELVADILYWLAQRYDPHNQISDNINAEKDRVEFIRSISTLFSTKARIKLTPRRLYQADSAAVQEMLKITTVLYKAYNSAGIQEEEAGTFSLPTKISNLKAHKSLANEICQLGAKLNDSLSKEPQLKKNRFQALNFLDSMGRSSDSSNDQAYIQRCVKEIIKQQDESMADLSKYVNNMEREQKNLEDKIKKKSGELQRAEKRYKSLVNAKPPFMDEYQRLEAQLERLYQVYVDKYRNLDYLQHQLDEYNKIEEEKFHSTQKMLAKIQATIKENEIKQQMRNQRQIEQAMLSAEEQENRGISRGNSRSNQNRSPDEIPRQHQTEKAGGQRAGQHQQVSEEPEQDAQDGSDSLEEEQEQDGESDGDF